MPKPSFITLHSGLEIPILYEDRSVLAIDKPPGWLLVPIEWKQTSRNLQRELMLSIQAGEHWARSRNLKYLRFVHRLDAETSGVLLLAKTPGALTALSDLFESRSVSKKYLAVVQGVPKETEWTCALAISPVPGRPDKMKVDPRGKDAETRFRVLQAKPPHAAVLAEPLTGRTHQIRVHAAAGGHPVLGDELYGSADARGLALRAIGLSYRDPFQKRAVQILAPSDSFTNAWRFQPLRDPNDRMETNHWVDKPTRRE